MFRTLLLFVCCLGWNASAKPLLVCANPILSDLASSVGGSQIDVVCLVPVGADPHQYEPSPADLVKAQKADLLVLNGLGLEPWTERVLRTEKSNQPVLVASEGVIPFVCHDAHDHGHDHEVDPHAWQDPRNVAVYVGNLARAIAGLLPDAEAAQVHARAAGLSLEFLALYEEARPRFAKIPTEKRVLVTSHDALGYFGRAFDLTIFPVLGLSTEEEPTARDLGRLVDQIRKHRVRVVYLEPTSNPKIPTLLAKEGGASVDTLFTDTLGAPGTPEATTLGMLRSNVAKVLADLETP